MWSAIPTSQLISRKGSNLDQTVMDVLDGRKPEGNMTSTMSPSPRSCAAMRWRPARLYGHVAIVSDASIVFASNKVG
jgi:hypothetical protein